jgi:hypothetical protein
MRCCVSCRKHDPDAKTREIFCRFVDVCFTCLRALCRRYWKCVTEYSTVYVFIYMLYICGRIFFDTNQCHIRLSTFSEKRHCSYSSVKWISRWRVFIRSCINCTSSFLITVMWMRKMQVIIVNAMWYTSCQRSVYHKIFFINCYVIFSTFNFYEISTIHY